MADMTAHTLWFKADDGEWSQINNVVGWVIATPLIGRGTYRDKPPVIPGAAAQSVGAYGTDVSQQVVGGVTPVATNTLVVGSVYQSTLIASSSTAQDDDYAHEVLRYVFGPEPMIFFKTDDANAPALPGDTTFSTDRPAVPTKSALSSSGKFPVVTGDCAFPWTKHCGVTNCPPPGWVVYTPAA